LYFNPLLQTPEMSVQPRFSQRRRKPVPEEEESEFFEKVVHINRCSKVVKGGRRFSFAALVVVGDQNGRVGYGYGKAQMVPDAIRKGTEQARKAMKLYLLCGDTIPHQVHGKADGGRVFLRPARPGTGIIAGGGVRAVLEAVGIKNILSKSMGSSNHLAVVTATIQGLQQLRTAEVISAIRGEEVKGMSMVSSTVLSSPSDPVDNSSDSTETSPSDIKK
jgi:small subunit ribosomal protein S5